jgi:hypothetical protein
MSRDNDTRNWVHDLPEIDNYFARRNSNKNKIN